MAGRFRDVAGMLREAQKVQAQIARIQQELAERHVEASAGGGAVRVVLDGRLEFKQVRIDPAAVESGDIPMLEDLIVAAVNEGIRKYREMEAEALAKLTGGRPVPGVSLR